MLDLREIVVKKLNRVITMFRRAFRSTAPVLPSPRNMSIIPYRITEGLYLENSGELLCWFKSLDQISDKGGMPLPEKGETSEIFWKSEAVFGGIHVSIQAMEYGSGIFFLDIKHSRTFDSVKEEYNYDLNILIEKFGKPTDSGTNKDYPCKDYPWVHWRWGEICLNLAMAERFMDYIALSISKGVIK